MRPSAIATMMVSVSCLVIRGRHCLCAADFKQKTPYSAYTKAHHSSIRGLY